LSHCTFYANRASNYGAGMRTYDFSDPIVENTIVAFSTQGVGISCAGSGEPELSCSDIYGNAGGDWTGAIADQYGINGNFAADPLFCNAAQDTLTLNSSSPCAPNNSPNGCGLVGACPVGCGLSDAEDAAPATLLALSVPSPFAPASGAVIRFTLPGPQWVSAKLAVYDLSGRLVRTLVSGERPIGTQSVSWDGRDETSRAISSGLYFCRLSSGGEERIRPLVLVR
jgi:hypothetical protein